MAPNVNYLVVLYSVQFTQNDLRHTVAEARTGAEIQKKEDWSYNVQAVVAETLDEAVELIRQQLIALFASYCAPKPNPADFTFCIRYSEISASGKLWINPNIDNCTDYPVKK